MDSETPRRPGAAVSTGFTCLQPARDLTTARIARTLKWQSRKIGPTLNFLHPWPGLPMALTPSQRSTREWPLLVMTVALVGLICFPLWQIFGGNDSTTWAGWTPERW